ncbi:MAG: hypothetical protein J6Y94_08545 [Bacteriovoracaceae bacterium]|nr:hypothetical protein [Bacteriovoracaceae bacterium]
MNNHNHNNPPKNPTKSVHLTLEEAPDPSRARKPSIRENDLHHFNDDGTSSCTYIMDKTGIYKNRFVAILRSNRVLIVLVILSIAILSILPLFVPRDLPSILAEDEMKKISALQLYLFMNSKQPIAPYIRCVVEKHNLKIYLPNNPETKANFYKVWSEVPTSIIPVYKCEEHGDLCNRIKKISLGIDEKTPVTGIENDSAATLEKNNYAVPLISVGDFHEYYPHYIAAMTDCVPKEYQLGARPIGKVLIIPGFERELLDVGRYYMIHFANFMAKWGFVFVIILIFLGYNKRPYSKRVEDHKYWSIK